MIFERLRKRWKCRQEENRKWYRQQGLQLLRQNEWPDHQSMSVLPPGMENALYILEDLAIDTRFSTPPFETGVHPEEAVRRMTWGIIDVMEAEAAHRALTEKYIQFLEQLLECSVDEVRVGNPLAHQVPDELTTPPPLPFYIREELRDPCSPEKCIQDEANAERWFERHPLSVDERVRLPLEIRGWCNHAAIVIVRVIRPSCRDMVQEKIRKVLLYLVRHYDRVLQEHEQLSKRVLSLEQQVQDQFPDFVGTSTLRFR